MRYLDAREWLEACRLIGCEFAPELLDLLDGEQGAIDNAAAIDDVKTRVPKEIKESPELWRTVEWINDRLDMLEEVEKVIALHADGIKWPNGSEPDGADDKLRAAFASGRWLEHDL